MVNDVTLVFPDIKGNSGTKSYVENTFNGLKKIGFDFDKIPIRKREITIGKKPYFGILFQYGSSLFKSANTKIVHSLSPDVVIKGTNLVTIHDIIPFTNPDIYMKSIYDKIAYKLSFSRSLKVQRILVSTEIGKRDLLNKTSINAEKIKVLHISIDHSKFFPESVNPYPKDGKLNLVMVSDFNPRKRIDKIIEAIGGDDEINFYHIGPIQGWSDRYRSLLKSSVNFKNIKFLGPLDNKKMREFITFSDLFVFLSDNEGFGLPPLEAMACGTNVLVNDLPVFRETMQTYANFIRLDKLSKNDIIGAIKHKIEKNCLIDYSYNFSVDKYAENLIEIYQSV